MREAPTLRSQTEVTMRMCCMAKGERWLRLDNSGCGWMMQVA